MSSPSRPLVSALHFLPGSFHTVLLLSRLPRQTGPGLPLSRSVFSCFPPCRSDTLRPRGEITQVISPLRSQQFCASAQNCRLKNKPSGLFFNLTSVLTYLPAAETGRQIQARAEPQKIGSAQRNFYHISHPFFQFIQMMDHQRSDSKKSDRCTIRIPFSIPTSMLFVVTTYFG